MCVHSAIIHTYMNTSRANQITPYSNPFKVHNPGQNKSFTLTQSTIHLNILLIKSRLNSTIASPGKQ